MTYLDLIHSMPFFQECKRRICQKLGIRPGASVLEIGCGNGIDAAVLAGMAGPTGLVIEIDLRSTMLTSAWTGRVPVLLFPHMRPAMHQTKRSVTGYLTASGLIAFSSTRKIHLE
jgi:predicted methyltransferase